MNEATLHRLSRPLKLQTPPTAQARRRKARTFRRWVAAVGCLLALVVIATPHQAPAQEASGPGPAGAVTADGQVRLPLDQYDRLVDASRTPVAVPRPVPASYALGSSTVRVTVAGATTRLSGEVVAEVRVEVLENGWTSVPVLPSGTAVESATVDGRPVQLIASPYGLLWGVHTAGSVSLRLVYRVDASTSAAGCSLAVPIPEASATTLEATLPGSGLDVAVIPAAGVRVEPRGDTTRVRATVPTSSGVQISWRLPAAGSHSVGRARYEGELSGQAVTWSGTLGVEVFGDETVTLDLLPSSATMRDVKVDGVQAPILVEGDHFATLVAGRGRHEVVIGFQTPVVLGDGPPRVDLTIPAVPVSRFDLTLPGKKEVSVTPPTNVETRVRGGSTVATAFVPMSRQVSLTWAEAVPEAVRAEVRANAASFHLVHAEEGVLFVRALVLIDVTRGSTHQVRLALPAGVQVNRIESPSGAVADWRLGEPDGNGRREVTVFLDREIGDELLIDVSYDRSLGDEPETELPLVDVLGVQRQRGMVALLQSRELTLEPVDEGSATRVGENQLPAFVRDAVDLTVAHTFKYTERPERMAVAARPPERRLGRFDAVIDTLVSLDEVSMQAQAGVELDVKSGGIMELELRLPTGSSLLSLAGPSVRTHELETTGTDQRIRIFFTQEMEGQLRLDLAYERILVEAEPEVVVPTISVPGAEVEQGRIAVEARSAVEVQAATVERLTPLDMVQLPQQLLLKTTNPILLAYKYVRAEPAPRLVLRLTRHQAVDVQEAVIDEAQYRTLVTSDGLAVTTVRFLVRNSREQFLRLHLPPHSEVWSASVDGRAEKPAADESGDEGALLLRIVTSTSGFEVRLVYATSGSPLKGLGTIRAELARPEILVTSTTWEVFLPSSLAYGEPSSNLELVERGGGAVPSAIAAELAGAGKAGGQAVVQPIQIAVPTTGYRLVLTKLYANQSGQTSWVHIGYASTGGAIAGKVVVGAATLVLWLGAAMLLGLLIWVRPFGRRTVVAAMLAAGLVLIVALWLYRASVAPVIVVSVLALGAAAVLAWRRRTRGPSPRIEPPEPPDAEEPLVSPEQPDEEQPDEEAQTEGDATGETEDRPDDRSNE